jgi:hypothetical protein
MVVLCGLNGYVIQYTYRARLAINGQQTDEREQRLAGSQIRSDFDLPIDQSQPPLYRAEV